MDTNGILLYKHRRKTKIITIIMVDLMYNNVMINEIKDMLTEVRQHVAVH